MASGAPCYQWKIAKFIRDTNQIDGLLAIPLSMKYIYTLCTKLEKISPGKALWKINHRPPLECTLVILAKFLSSTCENKRVFLLALDFSF